jgi:uncharacterized protein YndB with AHSA1/START domain
MSNESAAAQEASFVQAPSGPETLVVEAIIPGCGPERLFAYWTVPALLTTWWPREAEIEPRVGGAYHLRWPSMQWHLFGEYVALAPGKTLAFTWRWEHEPQAPTRTVEVDFTLMPSGGTVVTVRHGPYADGPAEAEARAGNVEGWLHFLGRLRSLAHDAPVKEPDASPEAEDERATEGEHHPPDAERLRR